MYARNSHTNFLSHANQIGSDQNGERGAPRSSCTSAGSASLWSSCAWWGHQARRPSAYFSRPSLTCCPSPSSCYAWAVHEPKRNEEQVARRTRRHLELVLRSRSSEVVIAVQRRRERKCRSVIEWIPSSREFQWFRRRLLRYKEANENSVSELNLSNSFYSLKNRKIY